MDAYDVAYMIQTIKDDELAYKRKQQQETPTQQTHPYSPPQDNHRQHHQHEELERRKMQFNPLGEYHHHQPLPPLYTNKTEGGHASTRNVNHDHENQHRDHSLGDGEEEEGRGRDAGKRTEKRSVLVPASARDTLSLETLQRAFEDTNEGI